MNIPRPGDTKYQVLTAIEAYWKEVGKGPTVEDLRYRLKLRTRSAVQFHIDDLKGLGLVENLPRRARSLRITAKGRKLISIFNTLPDKGQKRGAPAGKR